MRLWSLHPSYLDTKGLLALWREGLLARKVLRGETRGYRNHPQLLRFTARPEEMLELINAFLWEVVRESVQRGYRFDASKILPIERQSVIAVTEGQVAYEWQHLLRKLRSRDLVRYEQLAEIQMPQIHPLFYLVPGSVECWEVIS